jgi:hypothetical protein
VLAEASDNVTLAEDPSTTTVWVPLDPPPTWSAPMEELELLLRSTVYVPGSLMQTTLLLVGKPLDQSDELAFQLVVPLEGPTQLSVQLGSAALGVADTTATAPADPSDAATTSPAMAALRTPPMVLLALRSARSDLSARSGTPRWRPLWRSGANRALTER